MSRKKDDFKAGDYVFIHKSEGEGAGDFEVNYIEGIQPSGDFTLKWPLLHTYQHNIDHSSQVIRIPQYRTVTIEEDKQLFYKTKKDGLGGVMALMSNSGFNIKGYIADPEIKVDKSVLTPQKMKKSNSGIVCGLANYTGSIARKVFDIKYTTRYPTITLPSDKNIYVSNDKKKYDSGKFQHITIPPDLNLHLTDESPQKDYKFFEPKKNMIKPSRMLSRKYVKLLRVTYPKIDDCPIFTNKRYAACFMMSFAKMPHWTKDTHFTLELFATQNESVEIPIGVHKKGELGRIHPFRVQYKNLSHMAQETVSYCLQAFVIASHEKEDSVQVEFWR